MAERLRDTAAAPGVKLATFYDEPTNADVRGQHYDEQGFVTIDWLKANMPFDDAVFYLCGPKPFLRALVLGLAAAGVARARIRYESFGPNDELLAA